MKLPWVAAAYDPPHPIKGRIHRGSALDVHTHPVCMLSQRRGRLAHLLLIPPCYPDIRIPRYNQFNIQECSNISTAPNNQKDHVRVSTGSSPVSPQNRVERPSRIGVKLQIQSDTLS
jgi:hypothetical protein